MRERQRAAGEKPRYDGTWRPEPGKTLPAVPEGRKPVVRFKNPLDGDVTWNDVVKGPITISNRELDDLVIADFANRRIVGSWSAAFPRRRRCSSTAASTASPATSRVIQPDQINTAFERTLKGDVQVPLRDRLDQVLSGRP